MDLVTAAEIQALVLSVKVAVTATIVSLPFAIGAAYIMANRQFPGKGLLNILLHIPLVVPPVVIGYALLVWLAPTAAFGAWLQTLGLNPSFAWQGAAIASAIMAFPLMVRSIRQSFEAESVDLCHVAATLGATPVQQFIRISLPLAVPGILTGSVLGFARAIGEFGATITFAANIPGVTQTLPLALYTAAQSPGGEEQAFRFAVLCLLPAIASLIVSEYLSRRADRNRTTGRQAGIIRAERHAA